MTKRRLREPLPDDNIPIDYYRVPATKWTFESPKTRKWVESWLDGRVLNAFAGQTELEYNDEIIRNDAHPDRPADYHLDVNKLGSVFDSNTFDTIIHDPPWSPRQGLISYDGFQAGEIAETARVYHNLLRPGGKVVSLAFTTTIMPGKYDYELLGAAIFCPVGRGDDYLGSVYRKSNRLLSDFQTQHHD